MGDTSCEIVWFAERDIDVWLAEELRLNSKFSRWFLNRVGAGQDVAAPAYRTRISVCQGRETDVEALFRAPDGATFAILVEDKIKADFQPKQMEDYVTRGELGVKDGRWREYAIVVFAPAYRTPFSGLPESVITIKFEEAADELSSQNDSRLQYRAAFLSRAARPYVFIAENENQYATQWWVAVNELVRAKYGDFFRPQVPRKTTYVNPRSAEQASYLRVDLKGDRGDVALSFSNFSEDQLRSFLTTHPDVKGIEVVKKNTWKDPVLQISNLKKFEISDDLTIAKDNILAAYDAAYRLLKLWKENKAYFDNAAAHGP
jgi:hypothetical protein